MSKNKNSKHDPVEKLILATAILEMIKTILEIIKDLSD